MPPKPTKLMKSILIVEDDEVLLKSISMVLESEGYKVSSGSNGQEAKDQLEESTPDLIITDIIMDDIDGFEVIIHAKKQSPQTKLIVISGGGIVDPKRYLATAESLGVECTMKKPFSLDELRDAVKGLLE